MSISEWNCAKSFEICFFCIAIWLLTSVILQAKPFQNWYGSLIFFEKKDRLWFGKYFLMTCGRTLQLCAQLPWRSVGQPFWLKQSLYWPPSNLRCLIQMPSFPTWKQMLYLSSQADRVNSGILKACTDKKLTSPIPTVLTKVTASHPSRQQSKMPKTLVLKHAQALIL